MRLAMQVKTPSSRLILMAKCARTLLGAPCVGAEIVLSCGVGGGGGGGGRGGMGSSRGGSPSVGGGQQGGPNWFAKAEGNIVRSFSNEYGKFEVRESLFMGPSGKAAKFESTFKVREDGVRELSTVIPFN